MTTLCRQSLLSVKAQKGKKMNALNRTWDKLISQKIKETKDSGSRWRPAFHIAPPVGWLNDPNGLCQYKGIYHVFYQYSPFDEKGGLKFWAHCTSRDMLHWKLEGVPLVPDQPYDCHGVYSGSAVIEDEHMYLYYTGNVKEAGAYDYINQGRQANTVRAVSYDGIHFERKELLLTNGDYPMDLTCHVRDPKVWKKNGRWYMVQGARTKEDQGEVLLFTSGDGVKWFCTHRLKSPKAFGYMWECPDLYEVDGYTVLSISPQGVEADGFRYNNVYQSVTTFLDSDFRITSVNGSFRELDGGFDFYAPQTFETEDGRRIEIGWMGMADVDEFYTNRTVEDGWQHVLTLPRELSVKDGVLCQNPIRELDAYWTKEQPFKNDFAGSLGKAFEIELPDLNKLGENVKITLAEHLWLTWNSREQIFRMEFQDNLLGSGRTMRGREITRLTDMRVIVDASCVEAFLNGGKDVFSTRFYPEGEEIGVTVNAPGAAGRLRA